MTVRPASSHISKSHPVWGAWIEIYIKPGKDEDDEESHPVWGAWIEIVSSIELHRTL